MNILSKENNNYVCPEKQFMIYQISHSLYANSKKEEISWVMEIANLFSWNF